MAWKENVVRAILLAIVCTCSLASANYETLEKPISVVLKGRVVCNADSWDFSDAAVAVKCSHGLNRKTRADLVSMEGKTDENGEFKVELPRSIISSILLSYSADHNSTLKGYCSARLLSNPQEKCKVPFPVTSSSDLLTLTSDCHGIRTFTFAPLSYCSQSKLCSHSDITCSSGHKSMPAGRVLHEVSKESSNGMDFLFPPTNLPPLPKPVFGIPPLNLPHPTPKLGLPPLNLPHPTPKLGLPPLNLPHPTPKLGLPPLNLPHPTPKLGLPPLNLPQPVLGFPPVHLPRPHLSLPPLPAVTPIPGPSLFG